MESFGDEDMEIVGIQQVKDGENSVPRIAKGLAACGFNKALSILPGDDDPTTSFGDGLETPTRSGYINPESTDESGGLSKKSDRLILKR